MPVLATMVVEYVANVAQLQASVAAAADSMAMVGAAAEESNVYLANLGDQAFTTGVGFDGMAASADTLAVSMADVDASLGVADASFVSVAASADAAVVGIGGVTAAADTYVVGMGGVTAETDAAAASMGIMDTTMVGASASAGSAAVSFDAFAIAEGAVATAGDVVEASLAAVGVALAVVTVAAGVVGVVTAKMSGDFEASMTRLVTSAGESHKNIKMIGDGILDMSVQVGTGAQKLGDAMFWIESGGSHGKKALEDLKIAAEGAKAENANLIDVTKTLMFTLNNYSDTGLTAAQAMNILIASAGQGEMSLQDLSSAVSNVMPTAHAFGIQLADVGAALATMTNLGDDASSAATHLAMMIKTLEAPSKAGADAIHSIGLTTQQVSDEMRVSLPGALELIVDHLKKKFPEGSTAYNEALKNISGGSKSMQAILETTGTSLDKFKNNIDVVTKAAKDGGTSVNNWSDIQGTFNFKVDQAKANLEQMGIKIGTHVLPWLNKLLDAFNSPGFQTFVDIVGKGILKAFQDVGAFITPLAPKFLEIANNFMKVTDAFKDPAIQKLAVELGGDLKKAIEWLINALASKQFGDFCHLVGVIMVDAIKFATDKIKDLNTAFNNIKSFIDTNVTPKFDAFKTSVGHLTDAMGKLWDKVSPILTPALNALSDAAGVKGKSEFSGLKIALDLCGKGLDLFLTGVNQGIDVLSILIDWVSTAIDWMNNFDAAIVNVAADLLNMMGIQAQHAGTPAPSTGGGAVKSFASGVENFGGGLAYVHQGEILMNLSKGTSVIPTSSSNLSSRSSLQGGEVHIHNHFYVDGKEVTTKVMTRVQREMRGGGLKK